MILQTSVLEFLVSGRLDGVTPNAPFQRADAVVPRPDPPGADPENIYQFEVENLGIIDLTFPALLERPDGPVTLGNRYVAWTYVNLGNVAGVAGTNINVAAFRPDSPVPRVQKTAKSLEGEFGIFSQQCIFVPHGSALQFTGDLQADPGVPFIIRFAVLLPQTRTEEELIVRACCCLDGIPDSQPTCLDAPIIISFVPEPIATGETELTINGDNFEATDVVTMTDPDGVPVAFDQTFVDETQIDLSNIVFTQTGPHLVTVAREDDPTCRDQQILNVQDPG